MDYSEINQTRSYYSETIARELEEKDLINDTTEAHIYLYNENNNKFKHHNSNITVYQSSGRALILKGKYMETVEVCIFQNDDSNSPIIVDSVNVQGLIHCQIPVISIENRSEIVKMANKSVPRINPN